MFKFYCFFNGWASATKQSLSAHRCDNIACEFNLTLSHNIVLIDSAVCHRFQQTNIRWWEKNKWKWHVTSRSNLARQWTRLNQSNEKRCWKSHWLPVYLVLPHSLQTVLLCTHAPISIVTPMPVHATADQPSRLSSAIRLRHQPPLTIQPCYPNHVLFLVRPADNNLIEYDVNAS